MALHGTRPQAGHGTSPPPRRTCVNEHTFVDFVAVGAHRMSAEELVQIRLSLAIRSELPPERLVAIVAECEALLLERRHLRELLSELAPNFRHSRALLSEIYRIVNSGPGTEPPERRAPGGRR